MQLKDGNRILLGDFKGRVGSLIAKYELMLVKDGKSERKVEKEFADSFDMMLGITFFKKDSRKGDHFQVWL